MLPGDGIYWAAWSTPTQKQETTGQAKAEATEVSQLAIHWYFMQ